MTIGCQKISLMHATVLALNCSGTVTQIRTAGIGGRFALLWLGIPVRLRLFDAAPATNNYECTRDHLRGC